MMEAHGGVMQTAGVNKPRFTTERFYVDHVGQHGIGSLKRHINRYKWAASHLENGWEVLDVGCGSGYGDPILLNVAQSVVGADPSEEAINYAERKAEKTKIAPSRLRYETADILFAGTGRTFDACVCIEVIEHVDQV